jgi:hypothetical protein
VPLRPKSLSGVEVGRHGRGLNSHWVLWIGIPAMKITYLFSCWSMDFFLFAQLVSIVFSSYTSCSTTNSIFPISLVLIVPRSQYRLLSWETTDTFSLKQRLVRLHMLPFSQLFPERWNRAFFVLKSWSNSSFPYISKDEADKSLGSCRLQTMYRKVSAHS